MLGKKGHGTSVLALAQELSLPPEIQTQLCKACAILPWDMLEPQIRALTNPETALRAQAKIAAFCSPFEHGDGLVQLSVMLAAADLTRARYAEAGVSDAVFLATMGCFRRFLAETCARSGKQIFDRAFWTWRQTAGRLFRLGELEYEYCAAREIPRPQSVRDTDFVLCVHIPSDAQLTNRQLRGSYAEMRRFFAEEGSAFLGHGMPSAVLCGTWLLAPSLQPLLPAESRIRRFASDYDIYSSDPNDEDFYYWLFNEKKPADLLPQETSLQRTVRAHLLSGGKIGMGRGILRADA